GVMPRASPSEEDIVLECVFEVDLGHRRSIVNYRPTPRSIIKYIRKRSRDAGSEDHQGGAVCLVAPAPPKLYPYYVNVVGADANHGISLVVGGDANHGSSLPQTKKAAHRAALLFIGTSNHQCPTNSL